MKARVNSGVEAFMEEYHKGLLKMGQLSYKEAMNLTFKNLKEIRVEMANNCVGIADNIHMYIFHKSGFKNAKITLKNRENTWIGFKIKCHDGKVKEVTHHAVVVGVDCVIDLLCYDTPILLKQWWDEICELNPGVEFRLDYTISNEWLDKNCKSVKITPELLATGNLG